MAGVIVVVIDPSVHLYDTRPFSTSDYDIVEGKELFAESILLQYSTEHSSLVAPDGDIAI